MVTRLAVLVRRWLRCLRLTDRIDAWGKWLHLPSKDDFDQDVERCLRSEIGPGDVVWDVGANRGRSTRLISGLVGREGLVVAIEPETRNMGQLASSIWTAPNVSLLDAALSDVDGSATLFLSEADKTGFTHSLARGETPGGTGATVRAFRGDTLVERRLVPQPSFVLIDVEGAEDKVLGGMSGMLQSPHLRGLLVEVHFGVLAKDGRPYAPVGIEEALRDHGLHVRWITRSHLLATRTRRLAPSARPEEHS
jgi:FkbM family methyltransferase